MSGSAAPDLVALFQSLGAPPPTSSPEALRLSAVAIPRFGNHRVARDASGAACILLKVGGANAGAGSNATSMAPLAPIELQHLAVQHGLRCRLYHTDGSMEERRYTVIRCVGADRELRTQFLRVMSTVLGGLGTTPSAQDVAKAIESLTELFRALERPQLKSAQGLWGELVVIARAPDAAAMVRAWHINPQDRYDFHAGQDRIEVKSALGRRRTHRFSLEQLRPPVGARVAIASVLVERAGGGLSLAEMIDEVRGLVAADPQLALRVDAVVFATLGRSLREALDERFDRQLSEQSLRLYDVTQIPTIAAPLPPEITDVRFAADLSGIDSRSDESLQALGGLFAAAV